MITAKKGKKLLALVSAAVISVGAAFSCGGGFTVEAAMNSSEFSSGYSYPTQMRGLTAFQDSFRHGRRLESGQFS